MSDKFHISKIPEISGKVGKFHLMQRDFDVAWVHDYDGGYDGKIVALLAFVYDKPEGKPLVFGYTMSMRGSKVIRNGYFLTRLCRGDTEADKFRAGGRVVYLDEIHGVPEASVQKIFEEQVQAEAC